MTDAETVALAFSRILRENISPEDMEKVIERNREDRDTDICHSHDFCDASMAMAKALEDTGFLAPGASLTEEAEALWDAAWNLAVEAEFATE